MKYTLWSHDVLLGSSDLELFDEGMGVHVGKFAPESAYEDIAPIFRIFVGAQPATSNEPTDCEKLQHFYKRRDKLGLVVRDESSNVVPSEAIIVYDYRPERGDDSLELEVILLGPSQPHKLARCIVPGFLRRVVKL